jgi:hypothetical protein
MATINPCPLPPAALLLSYQGDGMYADCYSTDVAASVSHAEFVEAFYTTRTFAVERLILKLFAGKPSTHVDAKALAEGKTEKYAAWTVEGRAPDQLLLADLTGRTRSWLMVAPQGTGTRLYFGSAVVPRRDPKTGQSSMGGMFSALLGFHRLYSRVLLSAARARLEERRA